MKTLLGIMAVILVAPSPRPATGVSGVPAPQALAQQRLEFPADPANAGRDAGMRAVVALPDFLTPLQGERDHTGRPQFEDVGPSDDPGFITIEREPTAGGLAGAAARFLDLYAGGSSRWPARTAAPDGLQCLIGSAWAYGLPPSAGDTDPATVFYFVGCEPAGDALPGVGAIHLTFAVRQPLWTEAYDDTVMRIVASIELAPLVTLIEATALEGRVAMVGADHVAVTYSAAGEAGPALGDAVTFSLVVAGRNVSGGAGRVIGADAETVFVAVTEGSPRLGMEAAIGATGTVLRDGAAFGFRGAGLAPDGIDGLFEMLLPTNALPHLHERTATGWLVDSLWGFHGMTRPADVPAPTGVEPDWEWRVTGVLAEDRSLEDALAAADEFEQRVYCGDPTPCAYRFRATELRGAAVCLGASYDVLRDGQVLRRRWHWVCRSEGARHFLEFERYRDQLKPDDDADVERMVKSFRPGG